MNFVFDNDKNQNLFNQRNVSFNMVIETMSEKGVLLDFEHPDTKKYPNQRIFVIEMFNYTYCVPYKVHGNT